MPLSCHPLYPACYTQVQWIEKEGTLQATPMASTNKQIADYNSASLGQQLCSIPWSDLYLLLNVTVCQLCHCFVSRVICSV